MKTELRSGIGVATAILCIALACPAGGVTVSYSVGGVGPTQYPGPVTPPPNAPWGPNGYPGDTVELRGYTDVLDLLPGTYVKKINSLRWTIDYTYAGTATNPDDWSDLLFSVAAARSMTVHTSTGALAQAGSLEVTWDDDYLSFAAGGMTSFTVLVPGESYVVHVTPLVVARAGGYFPSPNTLPMMSPQDILCALPCAQPERDMMAQFVVDAPVPVRAASWGRVKMLYR